MRKIQSNHLLSIQEALGAFELVRLPASEMQGFRALEPSLVSVADKQSTPPEAHWVVGVEAFGQVLGVTSCVVDINTVKPDARQRYGRIDLVIVPPKHRGLGISRVMCIPSAALPDIRR
jgi:hypothetical protein